RGLKKPEWAFFSTLLAEKQVPAMTFQPPGLTEQVRGATPRTAPLTASRTAPRTVTRTGKRPLTHPTLNLPHSKALKGLITKHQAHRHGSPELAEGLSRNAFGRDRDTLKATAH
ncbi:MAG: hypothetical protein Q8J78_11605, partial [Moraxellaceae bacterium]|nr:hypothetical protein [Moraxellaceae bacterium]